MTKELDQIATPWTRNRDWGLPTKPTANLTQAYPTEKEVYAQNLRATQDRGFGILLTCLDLGKLEPDEPGWARVELVGEEYNSEVATLRVARIKAWPVVDGRALPAGRWCGSA